MEKNVAWEYNEMYEDCRLTRMNKNRVLCK
jgi:hypothetical protein